MRYATRALRAVPALLLSLVFGLCLSLSHPARASTLGEQKTAVMLVNFQDHATQPMSRADAHAMVFGTVSDFYWEASYGKTFLSGDTHGWFTIPVNESLCDYNLFAREADKLAAAAGIDLSQYSRLVYLMPRKVCMDGGSNVGAAPARVFLTGNYFNAQMIAHEVGHTFGAAHSAAIDCGSAAFGSNCANNSYGDMADTMGSGQLAHFNALHKERIGWLGASGTPAITAVSGTGTYTITPFETTAAGAKALKIPRGIDPIYGWTNYYYVEYRQPVGFDAGLGSLGNLTQGVLIRADDVNSLLLDMTPDSNTTSMYNDTLDAALMVGRSYVDSAAGITVTLKSADANGAVVEVRMDGASPPVCSRAAPTLAISGSGTAVAPGTTVQYTLSLTNRDSSACAATTFNLARSVPSGWTGTLAASQLTLGPGASANTAFSVTSPATATAGAYGIGVGASSGVGSAHTASASGTYSIAATAGALAESVATDKSSYLRGETVALSARVTGNGVPVAGASVRFTITPPSGSASTLTATTGADGYARATLRLGKGKAAVGGYTVRGDASSGSSTATAGTSFNVR